MPHFFMNRLNTWVAATLTATVLWLPALAGHADEFDGFGPLPARCQNPIYLLKMGQQPADTAVLAHGESELRVDFNYSSVIEFGRRYGNLVYLDMELLRLGFNYSYGLSDSLELNIEVPFIYCTGGMLDGAIEGFHRTYGFPNGARDRVPRNEFAYLVRKDEELLFVQDNLPIGMSDVTAGLKYRLLREQIEWPALACFARIKLPTGGRSAARGGGSADLGLGIALEKSYGRLHLYGGLDMVFVGNDEYFGSLMHNDVAGFMAAAEYNITRCFAVIVQAQGTGSLLTGFDISAWDEGPQELLVGLQGYHRPRESDRKYFWKLFFAEDINVNGPSADITFGMSIGARI